MFMSLLAVVASLALMGGRRNARGLMIAKEIVCFTACVSMN